MMQETTLIAEPTELAAAGPRSTRHRLRISPTAALYNAVLVAAYLPVSVATPLGFVSLADVAVGLLLVLAGAWSLLVGRVQRFDAIALVLSLVALFFVVAAQLGHPGTDVSPMVKFAVFLVAVPLALVAAGIRSVNAIPARSICVALALSGTALAVAVMVQVLAGNVVSNVEGTYSVLLLGVVVNKNAVGMLLMFSVIGGTWLTFTMGRWRFLPTVLIPVAVTLWIGARTATGIELLAATWIYVALPRFRLRRLAIVALAVAAGLAAIFTIAAVADLPQVRRMFELFRASGGALTSGGSRLLLWHYAADRIAQIPWLGHGYETFRYVGDNWLNGIFEPHNNVLQIAYAGGLVGLAAFVLLLLRGLVGKPRTALSPIVLVSALCYFAITADDIIWLRGSGHLFWMLFFTQALLPNGSRRPIATR